ncbi:MAG: hypothetical protein ACI9OJ_001108, partial [Myxococcota bacterium]
ARGWSASPIVGMGGAVRGAAAGFVSETLTWKHIVGRRHERNVALEVVRTGELQMTGSPARATVFIDGPRAGTLPLPARSVAPGKHHIRIVHKGFAPQMVEVAVSAAVVARVAVKLADEIRNIEPDDPPAASTRYSTAGWITLGSGVALLATGGGLLGWFASIASDVDDLNSDPSRASNFSTCAPPHIRCPQKRPRVTRRVGRAIGERTRHVAAAVLLGAVRRAICDDTLPTVKPGASDPALDGIDTNCDGTDGVDEDGDGVASTESGGEDCVDLDAAIRPCAADIPGGQHDTNCDGLNALACDSCSPSHDTMVVAGECVSTPTAEGELCDDGDPCTAASYCAADAKPAHSAEIGAYFISATEVTVGEFRLCVLDGACEEPVEASGCTFNADDTETNDLPVSCVNWTQAQAYCKWRSGHLPTEAEWEAAAGGLGHQPFLPARLLGFREGFYGAGRVPQRKGSGRL